MTIDSVRAINANSITPVDVVLEWEKGDITLFHGEQRVMSIAYDEEGVKMKSESVDKIVINDLINDTKNPDRVIKEARRLLKKNGTMFLSFYHFENKGPLNKWINQLKLKWLTGIEVQFNWPMDHIASMIEEEDMIIDKNIVMGTHHVYFEVKKLESDDIKKVVNL